MMNTSKQVKCRSGLIRFECRLRHNYAGFPDFRRYSETHGLHSRLGFKTAGEAWHANPVIQGSVEPSDFRIVRD